MIGTDIPGSAIYGCGHRNPHRHGTRIGYQICKCRCPECSRANLRYVRAFKGLDSWAEFPHPRTPRPETDRWERFDHYGWTETKHGCWEWLGPVDKAGYGVFFTRLRSGRRQHRAHRLALERSLGSPIPADLAVMHTCDNPPCVNPAHLSAGTIADNNRDKTRKGRQSRGAQHGMAVLTEQQALDAFRRVMAGESRAAVARSLGVSPGAVSNIANGSNWAWLTSGEVTR